MASKELKQESGNELQSSPSQIDAPPRTGMQSGLSDPSADERTAKIDLKPLGSLPPSDRAEAEVDAAVAQSMHEQYVREEAQRRVRSAQAQRLMDSVNTQNPYGLKEGEKPVYAVGGWLCDPNGTRIQRAPASKPIRQETIVDSATSMKEM